MTALRRSLLAGLGVVALSSMAGAQGTLSTQGLGFPPGQLSTKAASMGGSIGESDAFSPLNPASISLLLTAMIAMQAEPEFREVRLGGKIQKTSLARFPLFFGSLPIGTKWMLGFSASTLFDRTWSTTSRDSQVVGPDTIGSTVQQVSDGSVVDLRMAGSYVIRPWLRVGVGFHKYSGSNAIRHVRSFDDTARFASDTQRTSIGYGGNAMSVGVQTLWPKLGALGVSYRRGGTLQTFAGDSVSHKSSAPDHFGVSAIYLGINGTALAFRAAFDSWSRTAGLSPSVSVHEGWEIGVGGDVQGPRFGSGNIALRAGARWRTLPYSIGASSAVDEKTYSGGLGFPLARGRSELSLGVLRSTRSGVVGASENAWTFSTGFSVRP
jgi:hypothetical protein